MLINAIHLCSYIRRQYWLSPKSCSGIQRASASKLATVPSLIPAHHSHAVAVQTTPSLTQTSTTVQITSFFTQTSTTVQTTLSLTRSNTTVQTTSFHRQTSATVQTTPSLTQSSSTVQITQSNRATLSVNCYKSHTVKAT